MLEVLNRSLYNSRSRVKALPSVNVLATAADATLGPFSYATAKQNVAVQQEQYRYYDGRVFSAIRVPTQRIAAQPVVIAKVGKPASARRSLESYLMKGKIREDQVPPHLKKYIPDEVEVITSHPFIDAMENPNDLMVPHQLWEHTVANLDVTGRSIWLITETDGRKEITPVPTTWVTPNHESKSGKFYAQWLIKPPYTTDKPIPIEGKYVCNFYFADPSNPFGCTSPLQMQARAVLADESISIAQQKSFRNSLSPGMAVIMGDAVTGDGKRQIRLEASQRRQLMTWIKQELQGVEKFGTPLILDALIKDIKFLQNKPTEMAYGESSGLTKSMIYEGFGVNPISAGQVEGSNRASSGIADHHLITNCVNPMLSMMSQTITKYVVPIFSPGQKLTAWIVPCDSYAPDLEVQKWTIARQMYAVTRNDVRTKFLGLSAVPGWDDVVIPGTMQSVQRGEPAEIATAQNTPVPVGAGNAPSPEATKPLKDFTVIHKAMRETWLKTHGELESQLHKAVDKVLKDQIEESADAIESNVTPPTDWHKRLMAAVKPLLWKGMVRGAAAEYAAHAKDTFELPSNVTDFIESYFADLLSQNYWSDIADTTRSDIADILEQGLHNGDSGADTARAIREAMGADYRYGRASRIARSEATGALNSGHFAAQEELIADGIGIGRKWMGIDDDVERPAHKNLNNVEVGADELFDVGGFPARFPGDYSLPAQMRCNCRCGTNLIMA